MELCNEPHEGAGEIVYEERRSKGCPLCYAQNELESLGNEIVELNEQLEELQNPDTTSST